MSDQKKKILTIDDDPEFNKLLGVYLKDYPCELQTTQTPKDFLQSVSQYSPDLCLVDLNIGNFQEMGFQIIEAIRNKKGTSIPIVVISKINDPEKITQAIDLGADDYITKPLDPVTLKSKINRLLTLDSDLDRNIKLAIIPSRLRACKIHFPFELKKISEDGIVIFGVNYLARGSTISLESPIFSEIFSTNRLTGLVVQNATMNPSGGYEIRLDYDSERLEKFGKMARLWIAHQK